MRLVTFTDNDESHIGVLNPQDNYATVIDLNLSDSSLPSDLVAFLEGGEVAKKKAHAVMENPDIAVIFPIEDIKLKAPIAHPEKIMCVGLNYRDHAEEGGHEIPRYPTIFAKYPNVVIGPYDPIIIPRVTDQVDWEGEFAFVIGKTGKYISKDDALDYLAGYMVFNDVSARDYQLRVSQWTIGKTFDTFGPMGPSLVTTDEIENPGNLAICTLVDGEVVQESNTRHLIFDVPHLIAFLSEVMTLKPGDVVSTGTPAGVGHAREPRRYLRHGNVVRVEIEGIGALENPVIKEE
jgi:acylpyruvate hydrolase